jgi:HK97 family phage prohead protease
MTVEMNRDLVAITRKLGEVKYLSAKIKQSPTDGSGRFVAVVSTFGPPPDTQGDIVSPGAFRASIAEASLKYPGALWPIFWMHRYDDPGNVIGVVIAAAETSEGLVIEGQLDLDNERAMNVYEGLLGNRIREWSIAYGINKAREDTWNGEHVRYLDELELLEISAVYSGANRFTRTIEVRSRPYATSTAGSNATVTWRDGQPDGDAYEPDELALINARLDQLASSERPRSPELARQVDDLITGVRLELVQEALDRSEQAAWDERMLINLVLDPAPVRVDARMRPVTG